MTKKASTAKKVASPKRASTAKKAAPVKKVNESKKTGIAKRLYIAVPALLIGVASVAGFSALVGAELNTLIVTPNDVSYQQENTLPAEGYEWAAYGRTADSKATFAAGPDEPPYGAGSIELKTPSDADKISLLSFSHVGTRLSDINGLRYSTYRSAGNGQQVAAINLQVDANGPGVDGGFTTLVFEPVNNANSPVYSGTWQSWDAYNGGNGTWWSSDPIGAAPNRNTFVSWNTIVANNPEAVVTGGFGVNQGTGNASLTTSVDGLYFGTSLSSTEYDFELGAPKPFKATAKQQCLKGNYVNFQTVYTNQGDCVSSVVSREKITIDPNPGD